MKKILTKLKDRRIFIVVLVALVILGIFLFYEYKITEGNFGVPLDDVYIHFQFAKKFSQGEGLSYNDNKPTPGSTSPAWTILISLIYQLVKNPIIIAKSLSALFFVLSGIMTYFIGERLLKSSKWALLATLVVLLTGRFGWSALSGMEVTFFTFTFLVFVYLLIKRKSIYLQAFVLGLASTIRPEGYLLFAFFIIVRLMKLLKTCEFCQLPKRSFLKCTSYQILKKIIISCFIYVLIISPYLIFTYKTTGRFLTNTFTAQSRTGLGLVDKLGAMFRYIKSYLYLLATDNPAVFLLIPLGIWSVVKQKKISKSIFLYIVLIAVGFPLGASVLAPNLRHHGRYIMPFVPIYVLVAFLGLKSIVRSGKAHKVDKSFISLLLKFIVGAILFYSTASTFLWANTFGWNIRNINNVQIKLGKWIENNLPQDAIVAVNDIGAIKYYSQNEIIDLIGLVSPEVLEVTGGYHKAKQEELWEYVLSQDTDYLIAYPCWFPQMSQEDELKEIYTVVPDKYTIIDCEMVVYEIEGESRK